MNLIYIGAVKSSKIILEELVYNNVPIKGVISLSEKEGKFRHSDYYSLRSLAKNKKINFFICDDNTTLYKTLKKLKPTLILVMGWSRLLKKESLSLSEFGAIGMHPAPLPFGRGRHPIIWSIILGLKKTKVTLFKLDTKADTGNIVIQKSLVIKDTETALSLLDKVSSLASKMTTKILKDFIENKKIKSIKQKDFISYSWRKRNFTDGIINFQFNSILISRMVRALSLPYSGAEAMHSVLGKGKIWEVGITNGIRKHHEYPGLVIGHKDSYPLICCFDKIIMLKKSSYKKKINIGTWFC